LLIRIIIDFNGHDYCYLRCFPKDDCVLKNEPCFEQDKCAVSWHADSTLHHFSSIGVYQFIDDEVVVDDVDDSDDDDIHDGNNDGVNDDDQWRLALRVWYDAEGPNASKAISSRSHEMRTMMEQIKNNNNNNNSKAQSSSSSSSSRGSSSSSSSSINIKDNIIDENKYNRCDDRKDYNQKKKTNKKRKIDYGDDDKNKCDNVMNIGIINDNLHDNNHHHHNDNNNRLNINSDDDDDDDDNSNKVSVPMIAPSLAVPLPHKCCYFLLDDFNHHHQHAVLAGNVFIFFYLSIYLYYYKYSC
jgi:hypothetical protein